MDGDEHESSSAGELAPHGDRRFAFAVAVLLLSAYVVTLAPGVTYWDSGEFLAAIKTLGIPHPPGTPLYILTGNVWAKIFSPFVSFAYSVNLLSAVCTAVACSIFALLMMRWTRDRWASAAGGLLAGLMSSVWLNANETEVYAPALLVSALILLAADNARVTREARWLILAAYLCGLGWSLQLSALVVVPGALALVSSLRLRGSWLPATLACAIVAIIGASAVLFMFVRAQHDPGVNQGNPATWEAFADVITRAQYQPVAMLPRQAPWYIQIGNLFEYADWQVALGLSPGAPPSWTRTPFTVAYALLGVLGCAWHRVSHRVSWRAMMFLFLGATLGVLAYLNMKASPSYGEGFLPVGAKHEARERDYFFALAFVLWGMWAGSGAVRLFVRAGRRWRFIGLAVASLPFLLNFRAVDRSSPPDATAARDSAIRILRNAPERAVVFAYGDNDTYPVWYLQHVEGVRTDVTLITVPLLGAEWYRAELLRRNALLDLGFVENWRGVSETMKGICIEAHSLGRSIVAKPVRDRLALPTECTL